MAELIIAKDLRHSREELLCGNVYVHFGCSQNEAENALMILRKKLSQNRDHNHKQKIEANKN